MDSSAKVRSVDAIEHFKAALAEFGEVGQRALSEAESEIRRTITWLKHDQSFHWRQQLKKRKEKLAQAKSELFRAQLSADQDNRSTTTERRAVEKTEKLVEEAEWKLQRIAHWVKVLEREAIIYKGQAQQMANALAVEVPTAGAKLENMVRIIEEYIQIAPPTGDRPGGGGSGDGDSMAQAATEVDAIPKIRDIRDAAPRQSRRDAAEVDAPPMRAGQQDDAVVPLDGFEVPAADAPETNSRVIIESGALVATEVFLERSQSVVPGDSGWYLGVVGGRGSVDLNAELVAMQVEDLLNQRPELASVLALPRGYAVVLRGRQVRQIWNDRSRVCGRSSKERAT